MFGIVSFQAFFFSFSCTKKVTPFISPSMEESGVGDLPLPLTQILLFISTISICY